MERPPPTLLLIPAAAALAAVVWLLVPSEPDKGDDDGRVSGGALSPVDETDANGNGAEQADGRPAGSARDSTAAAAKAARQASAGAARNETASPAERRRMQRDRERYQQLRTIAEPTEYHVTRMNRIEQRNRYPRSNRRFMNPEHDPVLRRRQADRRSGKSEDGQSALTVWADRNFVSLGDAITIHALHTQRPASASNGENESQGLAEPFIALLTGELKDKDGSLLHGLEFVEEGSDGTFRAQVPTGTDGIGPGVYTAYIHSSLGMAETLSFSVRAAQVKLTGEFSEAIEGGDLLILVELDVATAGTYHVHGSLYAGEEFGVGDNTSNHELEVGRHFVSLRFHGRLLHDGGRGGPYRLGQLSVTSQGSVGSDITASPDFETAPYVLDDFRSAVFNPLD